MPTEVIELLPGHGGGANDVETRADWSPTAQPPGRDGIIAHTPDPRAYHRSADGRTILPRSTKHGASRAFDAGRPGLLNVDPTDPLTGRGGTLIDVEDLRRDEALLQRAADLAEGDAAIAWDLVTKGRSEVATANVREAPSMPGYLVPSSRPGGQQVTGAGNYAAGVVSPGTTAMGAAVQPVPSSAVINPAIHHKEQRVQPPQQVSVTPPVLTPAGPPVPAANQAPDLAAAPVQQPQPAQMPILAPQQPVQPQTDPTQLAILQTLQSLTTAVAGLKAPAPPLGESFNDEQASTEADQQYVQKAEAALAVRMPEAVRPMAARPMADNFEVAPERPAVAADKSCPERQMDMHLFGLSWLQPTPQRPEVKAIFDLGPGGQHLKRFHHVEFTKDMIILIYDDRYEGDRFMPPATAAGQPIRVEFPDRENQSFYVLSPATPRLNFPLGCMDILELVITQSPEETVRPPEQQTDAELASWRDEIPTRMPEQEGALEQAIRNGRFDAGAGGTL